MTAALLKSKRKSVSKKETKSTTLKASLKKHTGKPVALKLQKKTEAIHKNNTHTNSFTIVAIGASAGGLEAVTQFFSNIAPNTGMAYIYVQHLSPDHKSILPELLSKTTKMKVQDIEDMDKMEPNNVYVIPYNKGIKVTDGHIKLIPRAAKSSMLTIDVLFTSLAETHHENVIGIVLSGNASDGTIGLNDIKSAGGITFAQDKSAKSGSMPESAIAAGVVDFVMSPKEIAKKVNWLSKHPLLKRVGIKRAPEDEIDNNNPHLKFIIQLLFKKRNVDFSGYKMNTIKRRILRRMLIHKVATLKQFTEILEKNNNEVDLLHQDLLINVTEFFRDPEAFLHLKKVILPQLLKNKTPDDTLRIWVAACATGEEVYSIAMLLLEIQKTRFNNIRFQIFASDLSPDAINQARNGEYTKVQLKNVSEKQLQSFFVKSKDKYRITKQLRSVCIFAPHDILRDPPFSKMDLISCRNLLIYLDTAAQKKAIGIFHYALNENGFLMLGKSETIGLSTQFSTVPANKKFKIYTRKKNSGTQKISDITPRILQKNVSKTNAIAVSPIIKKSSGNVGNISNAFDFLLLDKFAPASVVINHDLEILQFRGPTALYLQNSSGKATLNILRMVHIEITFELRNAIHHAIKTKQTVLKNGIEMNRDKTGSALRIINLEVTPLKIEGEEPLLAIIFTEQTQSEQTEYPSNTGKNKSIAKDRRIKKLEEEITAARNDMATITQDQETANEELQSANEEIVSSNEELQSLNEELETSKEEIESTNEELITTNQELQARNVQVEELFTYYETILSALHEPMLILDKDIRIVSANKSFCKTFHVSEENCLGMSLYKLGNNQWNIPRLRELLEEIVPKNNRFQDFEVALTLPVIGHKIMILNAHRIVQKNDKEELIVLTIIDITEVRKLAIELQVKEKKVLEVQLEMEKKAHKLVELSNKGYNMLLLQSPFAIAILKGKDMVISLANDSIKEMWGKGKHIEGKTFLAVLPELANEQFPELLAGVYKTGIPFYGYELFAALQRNGKLEDGYFNFVYQPYRESNGVISGVTIIAYEVTDHVIAKNELKEAKRVAEQKTQVAEDAVKAKQQFLSNMSHEIRTPMNAIVGFTNVVLKTKLDASQKEYINAIKISGDALIILINDILDLAKVDAGKMTFEQIPFNLSDSISSMLHLFEARIKENNIELIKEYDTSIPEILIGDPLRLRQIILNLMSNAVKFTKAGKITMRIHRIKEDDEKINIEFKLSDTGIGIAKNRQELVFSSFEQAARETSRSYGGSGLGLAIVKQLVELQGGTITLTSELGKGSTFGFTMSFEKTTVTTEPKKDHIPKFLQKDAALRIGNKPVKVLVVEDMALNQLLIKIILLEFGFDFDIAGNGKIAIESLQKNNYDIILMDLQMPEMSGFEATTYIRKEMNSKIPIIALTADVTTVDVEKCMAIGMNDYISKPIDEKLLYSKIIKHLKKLNQIA